MTRETVAAAVAKAIRDLEYDERLAEALGYYDSSQNRAETQKHAEQLLAVAAMAIYGTMDRETVRDTISPGKHGTERPHAREETQPPAKRAPCPGRQTGKTSREIFRLAEKAPDDLPPMFLGDLGSPQHLADLANQNQARQLATDTVAHCRHRRKPGHRPPRYRFDERSPRIAYDFDGPIHDTSAHPFRSAEVIEGAPTDGAFKNIRDLLETDSLVIVHTCRLTNNVPDHATDVPDSPLAPRIDALLEWFRHHGAGDIVDHDGFSLWTHGGKPPASVYIDDKALRWSPDMSVEHIREALDRRPYRIGDAAGSPGRRYRDIFDADTGEEIGSIWQESPTTWVSVYNDEAHDEHTTTDEAAALVWEAEQESRPSIGRKP